MTTPFAAVVDVSEVIVCCGPGGVGKTTTAAAIGIEAARRGRRVVVVTIDPARRLADAFGLLDGLGPHPQRVGLTAHALGELWAMMLDAAATFDGLVLAHSTDAEQAKRILTNRLYRNIAEAMSGTQEYMAAETLYALHQDKRFDLVVVDTPPSRQALNFLEAPGVLSRFLDHRVFKFAMLSTRGGLRIGRTVAQPMLKAIGKVVGSDVLSDSLAFFQSFAGMESGFRSRADEVIALLRSDRTSFVVVSSPRRDAVGEAVWFARQLREQGVGVAAAIANRVQPAFGPVRQTMGDVEADSPVSDVVKALRRNALGLNDIRNAEIEALDALMDLVTPDRVALLPLLDADVHDLDGLLQVATHLFPGR